jgi:hypothetical protein
MTLIPKLFWRRGIRHEMRSVARVTSLIAGFLLIISGLLGTTSLALGLILGVGVILLSGRLKHKIWSAAFLVVGLVAYSTVGGIVGEGGAVLLIIAAILGLLSSFI